MLSNEYFILLILLLLALCLYKQKWLVVVIVAYMAVLALFRAESVGTDVGGYKNDFFLIRDMKTAYMHMRHTFEIGYVYAIVLFRQFSSNYLLFISLTFIPFFWGILKFIKDSRVNIAFALFVFYTLGYYFIGFNAMRQMLAIGLILAAFPFLYARKYILFAIITITVSYLFHRSEVMLLLLIPLHYYLSRPNVQMNKTLLYILIISSYCVFFIGTIFLSRFFLSIVGFLPGAEYYESYIIGRGEEIGRGTGTMYTLFALILTYVKNKKNYVFETYTYVMSIVLYNIFNMFSVFGLRVFYDFNIITITLIPQMIFDPSTKYRNLFLIASIIFCIGEFIYAFVINNWNEVNPYIFR